MKTRFRKEFYYIEIERRFIPSSKKITLTFVSIYVSFKHLSVTQIKPMFKLTYSCSFYEEYDLSNNFTVP